MRRGFAKKKSMIFSSICIPFLRDRNWWFKQVLAQAIVKSSQRVPSNQMGINTYINYTYLANEAMV
jgi:hypothetical protein